MPDMDRGASKRTSVANGASRTELEYFVATHSAHGGLAGHIGDVSVSASRHTIACSCGATFHRCVVPRSDAKER